MELRPLLSHRRHAARRSLTLNPASLQALLARAVEPRPYDRPDEDPAPRAAVLVPVVLAPDPVILLTRRSATLHRHADQVSFPGGRIDPTDAGPEQAALREAHEEVGLDPDAATLLGRLPVLTTSTGFHITPVLACIRPDAVWRAAPSEVSAILFLPAARLLDPASSRRDTVWSHGAWHESWVWSHPDHLIWGATAAILATLAGRLREQASAGLCPKPRQGQSPLDPLV